MCTVSYGGERGGGVIKMPIFFYVSTKGQSSTEQCWTLDFNFTFVERDLLIKSELASSPRGKF